MGKAHSRNKKKHAKDERLTFRITSMVSGNFPPLKNSAANPPNFPAAYISQISLD